MNSYQDTLNFLFSQLPAYEKQGATSYKPGLGNSIALDEYCEHPHRKYPCIHVGGTNGKGSVSHTLAAILQSQGYRVGLYTSPHLLDFGERIKVNGKPIEINAVVNFTNKVRSFASTLRCSFFELTSAMAFEYFAQQQVDIAIIEVGLGGRLDSTNIITPILSIITNISIDHSELLGSTISEIATEKAGIIKPNVPVIIGESHNETNPIFETKAKNCKAMLSFADQEFQSQKITEDIASQTIQITSKISKHLLTLDLQGCYQLQNCKTSFAAITQLNKIGITICESAIYNGFANVKTLTGLQGRWQILNTNPLTICDTAHNYAGISQIMKQLQHKQCNTLHIVWSNVREKDLAHIVSLLPERAKYYLAQLDMPRAMSISEIEHFFKSANLFFTSFNSINAAIAQATKSAKQNDIVFIGGSTFTVAEALTNLASQVE